MRFLTPIALCLLPLAASAAAVQPVPVVNVISAASNAVDIGNVDVKPQAVSQARPRYPDQFRAAGVGGFALIDFLIEKDGSTSNVQIVRATDQAFGDSARDAVSKWIFDPGRQNGHPVRVHLQVPLVFKVDAPHAGSRPFAIPPNAFPDSVVMDVSKVSIPPVPVSQARPQYPGKLRAEKVEGNAVIYFIVRRDGTVSDVTVANATDPLFGAAAATAVGKWVFHPARKDDRAVNCQLGAPIKFSIDP